MINVVVNKGFLHLYNQTPVSWVGAASYNSGPHGERYLYTWFITVNHSEVKP